MSPPTVIGLGELLWDVFPDFRRAGGAPANVACHANQLGAVGLPASRVGSDDDGDALLDFLNERRISTRLIQRDPALPTGRVTVQFSQEGEPQYVIHHPAAWDHLEPSDQWLAECAAAAAICFGTLAQRSAPSREAIHRCLQAAGPDTLIVYDVNLRQEWYAREWIDRSLRAANLVKLNEAELATLGRLLDVPDRSPRGFADYVHTLGVGTVVITRAERGCLAIRGDQVCDVPGTPVDVIDPVGAGDAFTAAFIIGTLRGWSLDRTARLANDIGALVASRAGAMPEISKEAERLLAAAANPRD